MPLVYPNPVTLGLEYLRPAVAARTEPYAAGAAVHATLPTDYKGGPAIVLRAAGGTSPVQTVDRPRLAVQVWHRDDFNAAALAQLVRGLLLYELSGWGPVRNVRDFAGLAFAPDPTTNAARYLFTIELTVRGSQA